MALQPEERKRTDRQIAIYLRHKIWIDRNKEKEQLVDVEIKPADTIYELFLMANPHLERIK